jgi:DNA-binding helix-hairpin-helix protein with protein kinase domain
MPPMLSPRSVLHTQPRGATCVVEDLLGEGTQGEVYVGRLDGERVAVKWYRPEYLPHDPGLRQRIEELVRIGSPGRAYLWPLELLAGPRGRGFGYVMPLRPARFHSLADLARGAVAPTFRAVVTTALSLAAEFLRLHAGGNCYRDISWGNLWFDPDTGEVAISDCDNIAPAGRIGAILGSPGFMAPELVRGEALPSALTDLHALAVMLFIALMVSHPLRGRRELLVYASGDQERGDLVLFGTEPRFIFDPDDDANRPDPAAHPAAAAYWAIYPGFVRQLFTQAFTEGLRDPHRRVTESEWRQAMARLRDSIFRCARCEAENFYDLDALRAAGGATGSCWSCAQPLELPPRMRLGESVVLLTPETRLYPHHLGSRRLYDFRRPIAEAFGDPLRLVNLSDAAWTLRLDGTPARPLPPGQDTAVQDGLRIDFGAVEAAIRA